MPSAEKAAGKHRLSVSVFVSFPAPEFDKGKVQMHLPFLS